MNEQLRCRIGRGRKIAEGLPNNIDDVVVMLDADCSFKQLGDSEIDIYWGVYVGPGNGNDCPYNLGRDANVRMSPVHGGPTSFDSLIKIFAQIKNSTFKCIDRFYNHST
jgi:hypothetical protein